MIFGVILRSDINQKEYVMRKNLNQELKDAFVALDAERVKALLAAGVDKRRRIRNEMLGYSCGSQKPLKPSKPIASGDKEYDERMQKRYIKKVQAYEEGLKSQKRHLQYMKLLLENGANPNWIDPNPSDYAVPLLNSLAAANFDEAQLLLDNGARVDMRYLEDTALTWFATRLDYEASLDTIKFLYKNGANLNAKGWEGKTALINMTGFSGFTNVCEFEDLLWLIKPIEFVVSHGANVNLRDKSGKTALVHSLAQEWGNWDNYHCLDRCEYTDNFLATFYYEIPKILLSNGARVSIKDKSGKDALAHAATDEEKMDLFARAIDDSNKFLRKKIVVMSR